MIISKSFLLCSVFILFFASCDSRSVTDESDHSRKESLAGYENFENDSLRFKYPAHWVIKFDEAPNFSTDLAVVLDASELSRIMVLVDKASNQTLNDIVNQYERRLELNTDESIENYVRENTKIDGKDSVTLTWQETKFATRNVSLTIVKVLDKPSAVFAIFDLDEEDLVSEAKHIGPVVKTIFLK